MHRHLFFALQEVAERLYGDSSVQPVIDYAKPGFGDYSSNLAFKLAGRLGRPPQKIAEEIAAAFSDPLVERAEAAAGYVNFYLTTDYWQSILDQIGAGFGHIKGRTLDRVQVEYISANPTGPLTLANARGGFVGDVVSNVLRARGCEVVREYYLNDAGSQVAKLVESLKVEAGLLEVEERQYRGDYLKELLQYVDINEPDEGKLSAAVIAAVRSKLLEPAIARLGLAFDHWQSERELVDNEMVAKTLQHLKKLGLTAERDGATWLLSEQLGDERDRVLVRSDGAATYLLGDLAYHNDIINHRELRIAIKLWGADHAGQVKSLRLGVRALAPQSELHFVLLQFVRLMEGGREVKMSKRAGTYVTVDELIDTLEAGAGPDHAVGVARWFFLSRSVDQRIDFDLELAKEQSAKNPYYYVMYAYARAHSIMSKAAERGLKPAGTARLSDAELPLVRQMERLDHLLALISRDFGVHRLTYFGYELATRFQEYYESTKIIDLAPAEAAEKLAFVSSFIALMDNYWALLGIKPTPRLETPVAAETTTKS